MYQPTPDFDDEEINLGDLLGVLIENRWLIIAITFVALLVGGYKSFTAVPIYRADGLIQVEENNSSPLANLNAASMLEEYTPVNAEIEILRSRSVLGDVVDNLKLDISAYPEQSSIGAALARRAPADERPMIKVDTLELPESMRGQSMKLVPSGTNGFELYDMEDSLLLRGTVGEVAIVDLGGGETLSLFVSLLQGERGPGLLDPEAPPRQQHPVLAGQSQSGRAG